MGFTINPSKFDFFFGKVTTGKVHNIERSAQNLKDLTRMGVTSEAQLTKASNDAFQNGTSLSTMTTKFGVTVTKRVNVGENGCINVGFFYPDGNMNAIPRVSTIIPETW